MKKKYKKLIIRFPITFMLGLLFSYSFEKLYWVLFWNFYPNTYLRGGESGLFLGVLFGIPTGCILGILITERILEKARIRVLDMIVISFSSFLGSLISFFMIYLVGPRIAFDLLAPFLATIFSTNSYDFIRKIRVNKKDN